MAVARLSGAPFRGVSGEAYADREPTKWTNSSITRQGRDAMQVQVRRARYLLANARCRSRSNNATKCVVSTISEAIPSDYDLNLGEVVEEAPPLEQEASLDQGSPDKEGVLIADQPRSPSVQTELIMLSLPAIAGQAIEPMAQLMETAYVGRLGPLELASSGVSISIFNILSKVFNIPLLSVATSFVAEEISKTEGESTSGSGRHRDATSKRKQLPSVSTALFLAVAIGVLEALAMYLGSGVFLSMMGLSPDSPMRIRAERFLKLRAIGAPAVVLYLAIQGIFRGFKDTRTPVLCLGIGNLSAVFMFPVMMNYFQLGVIGAAISTVVSQYIVAGLMLWYLNKKTVLSIPAIHNLQFGGYLRSGVFLLGRTLAAVMTITLSTSMAARQGPIAMAAHQICLQVYLSVALLSDAQAASAQALIASSAAKQDYSTVKDIAFAALKTGLFTGISLAILLGASFGSIARLFTKDAEVLAVIGSGLALFLSASQPITSVAYIFDGLHYGISDFPYAAWATMVVGAISCAFMLYAPSVMGLSGVWLGLTLFMWLRSVAGYMRLLSKNGPWWFLQGNNSRLADVVA